MTTACMLSPLVLCAAIGLPLATAAETYSWQNPQATLAEKGDITWTPKVFAYTAGDSIRYIDFEKGSDDNDGSAPTKAWKHHPWDSAATGQAKAGSGIHTYVFKGGVDYRGTLRITEGGEAGNPIRLTRDPAWGQGPAVISGSEQVTTWTKGATNTDIPEADQVWWADLDFAPRTLWQVAADGSATRIPLARTPNWTFSNPDDLKEEWWHWDNPGKPFGNTANKQHLGIDTVHIKDKPESYFKDAVIWSEFGWVMGGPYPTKVDAVDFKQHGLQFSGWTGPGNNGVIFRNMRYYLEDKPQYLDDPNGEFWFEKKGDGGRLFLRTAKGADPNGLRIEAGKRGDLIVGNQVNHLDISGLDFRFTTPTWDLTVITWDFSTKPWGFREDANPACIRVWGEGQGIRIANCRFNDVVMPIKMRSLEGEKNITDVVIEDNEFLQADEGVLSITGGAGWGFAHRHGRIGNVHVLRNHSRNTGMRPSRYGNGTAMDFGAPRTLEVAGNVIERSGAQGINVVGGKSSGTWGDVPFSRVLIHHNKVWQSMQYCNDYGGIEAWQGGPTYIYDNISYDARGMWYGHLMTEGSSSGFGHAYYLDGAYKTYLFNNIAWGRSNDKTSKLVNCSAFQEIHAYENAFFNNTAYNYTVGSRRQAPEAGRNKYLGNVFSNISERVFRHSDPAKTAAEGNARDAGEQKSHFHTETNAYALNVFHDVAQLGVFEPSGRWLESLADFSSALAAAHTVASSAGVMAEEPLLQNPAQGDFRPTASSPAIDTGAKVFVPWALSGVVGEWHFYHTGGDPSTVFDEHWYLADYFLERTDYHSRPTFPLVVSQVSADDYVQGELENWVAGALRLQAANKQFATASNDLMEKPISFEARLKSRHEGAKPEPVTISGTALKSPQIFDQNLTIEIYAKVEKGAHGILVSKRQGAGYDLRISNDGKLVATIAGEDGVAATLPSTKIIADGAWHHLVIEADRQAQTLTMSIDGKQDTTGKGLGAVSLANPSDLYVGGSPTGDYLDVTIDFLRIAQGTLADAQTTIGELYAWEFNGPQHHDFSGRKPTGKARDAGAIEAP